MTSRKMPRRIGDTWSSVSGLLHVYSAQSIKEILSKAGLAVFKIPYEGTYRGPVLDGADKLVRGLDDDSRDRFVVACIEEIVSFEEAKAANLAKQKLPPDGTTLASLEEVLARVGFGLHGRTIFPLTLQLDLEATSLSTEVSEVIAEALRRYRDGKFAGAITSICGAVDKLTERVFSTKKLGDHQGAAYQERVSKWFASLETEYCAPLSQSGVAPDEVKLVWENHKKSVSQAACVLGAFRRAYSDAHGKQNAPREFVQKSFDCAVFILRSFSGLLKT